MAKATKKINTSVLIIALSAVGVLGLVISGAASSGTYSETENANLVDATVIDDSSASNGEAVVFGDTTPPGTDTKCADLTNLKFCDDFDGAANTYPDSSKWNVFTSGSSWGSHCWKKAPANISLDGSGFLRQTLVNEGTTQCTNSYGSPSSITSGGMDTRDRFTTKYGKFEIRAKLSCASSVWGAFWLSTGTGPGWPRSGEIDIYEIGYNKYNRLQQTVWVPNTADTSTAKSVTTYVDLPTGQRWCDEYHVYGLEWRQNSLQFLVDDIPRGEVTPADIPAGTSWPFNDYNLRLLVDLQYGATGRWTGDPNPSQLPSTMLVDYVRIYN